MSRHQPVPIELVRPSFYGMLVCYYAGLMTYGATAVVFSSPSLVRAGGNTFSVVWAALVTGFAFSAMVGVLLSRRYRNGWLELASALALVSMLAGYSAALLIRAFHVPGATSGIALAWLPLILAVMPSWRMLVMVADGSLIHAPHRRHQ